MADTEQLFTLTEKSPFMGYSPSIFQTKYGISSVERLKRSSKLGKKLTKKARYSDKSSDKYKDDVDKDKDEVIVKSEPLDDAEDYSMKGNKKLEDSSVHSTKPANKSYRNSSDTLGSPPTSTSPFICKSSPRGFDGQCTSPGSSALPDSSTGSCEQLLRTGNQRSGSISSLEDCFHSTTSTSSGETIHCQVCGDLAAGFYCGAYICEACKKFFIRASKLDKPRYVCLRQKDCVITKESRVHCQYCRYQKCLQLNMFYPKDGQKSANKVGVQEIPCRVCSAPSSGFHFGALTCEGCKGFFRRMVKEREAYTYKCSKNSGCEVNAMTRNMCKACRYNKCLQIGMSVEGSRIGRQPNAVKHAISLEAKKQVALKTEPGTGPHKHEMDTSPSNFNFDSVVLDPCMAADMEDSLQSVDHQTTHGTDKTSPMAEYSHKRTEARRDADDSSNIHSPPSIIHSHQEMFRMPSQAVQDHSRHSREPYPHNSPPFHPCTQLDIYSQPQDEGIDLSMSRSPLTSSNYSSAHLPATTHQNPLPLPTYQPPPSPCYSSPVHTPQGLHTSHQQLHTSHQQLHTSQHRPSNRNSSVDRDEAPRHYYTSREDYSQPYPTYQHTYPGLAGKEGYPERSSSPSPQPANSYNSVCSYNKPHAGEYHQQHHSSPYLRPESEPPHYSQHYHSDMPYPNPLLDYTKDRQQHYRQHMLSPDRSPESYQPHNLSIRQPQHYPQYNRELMESKSQPKPTARRGADSAHMKPNAPVPQLNSPLNYHKPKPATPQPVHKKSAVQEYNGKFLTFQALHDELKSAATNLFHICVTDRAKSDIYDPKKFENVDACWERMMEHFNFHAKCIVRFAKRVPGFKAIKLDDQVQMLKMATYCIVILIHSREYEPDTGFYNYFNFSRLEIPPVKELFPEFEILFSHFKHTGVMAKRLCLTDTEYAYLSCMLLLDEEYPGLEDPKKIKELKEKYTDAFHEYEIENFPNGSLRFGEMLLRLSEFSQFSMQHNIAVGLVITKNSQLHIPQLYAEMYNTNDSGANSD
ncbi:uncharacterized protein LOC131940188 [Physella acuta]|uniref:uncharacterized protein LOC131940188 n=1 Tax=Physella acuta TaxID=109671 RepID=UPI0027DE427A|nr:uncharacterized protein LOC131940188 [Physella acuta]XP_059154808.1 uncharacterized protein LOC131940188 [Physella acuta]XP_059154813.1 uncharacterized protein LOC131940188 [Physella acuta]XP_059154817.1 uncharacterized protein LOC131940188 [Physella acuta]XP_059154821.1 uncharacterized protein LOC131940188 [Physella acuta]XP_059154829.1 uncharacterized protein LOC131940188 [Physella acuta]